MSELLVTSPVTPESAGWDYVGFEVVQGEPQARVTGDRELCLVVVEGVCDVRSTYGEWKDLGGRTSPFEGRPDAAYLPPGTEFEIRGSGEIALCTAPAKDGADPRVLWGEEVQVEVRGHGAQERTVTRS